MIVPNGKYYLYRHIRLDKNEPLYIGVAKKANKKFKKFETEYSRAFEKRTRSNIWKGITTRTDYKVEIILESDDKKFIEEKEIEFIALYGRIVLGTGTLTNLHRGGNYKEGHKLSDEQAKAIGDRSRGEKSANALKVYNTETFEIYFTINESSKIFNIEHTSLSDMLKGKAKNTTPLMLYNDYLKANYRAFSFIDGTLCPVIDYITLEIFTSITEAANSIGISFSKLSEYLNGSRCTNPTNFIKVEDYEKGLTPQTLFKGRQQKQEVYNIKTSESYTCVKEVSEKTGISTTILYHKLSGSCINDTDFIYRRDFDKGLLPKDLKIDGKKKPLIDKVTLKIYGFIKEAADEFGIGEKLLASYLNPNSSKKNKTNLVYLSTYIKENPDFIPIF